jgi:hypothetical protein
MWECLREIKSIPWEDVMSASGIPDSNPVQPASWAPASHDGGAPAAQERHRQANSGVPPKPSSSQPPKPAHPHKVDVKA